MSDTFDQMAFWRDLTPEEAASLEERLAGDPEAAAAFRAWRRGCAQIGRDVRRAAEPELIAASALRERPGVLSDEELLRLDARSAALSDAFDGHPGLSLAARDLENAAAAFEELWDTWFAAAEHPAEAAEIDAPPVDGRRPRPDRGARPHAGRKAPRRPAARWAVRGAIIVSGIVFVGLLALLARQEQQLVTVETAADEVRVVELTDGSTVRLLGGSRLSYVPPAEALPFGKQVTLEGRAFFDIMSADRGFVVRTANAQATVLGTTFGVATEGEITEVVLAEGRLSLAPRGDLERVVVLEPGQMSRVVASQTPTPPEPVVLNEQLAWTGLFIFNATPLEVILKELGTHFSTQLSADDELLGERVTGRFRHEQPLQEILDTIAAALGARVVSTETGYRLARGARP